MIYKTYVLGGSFTFDKRLEVLMSTGGVGFPVPGWFVGLPVVGEYGDLMEQYEAYCRDHAGEIVFTHDLWLKGNGSGGMAGVAGAYFVGQAAFLEAPMPGKSKDFLNGCFWLGDKSHLFYRDVPIDLLVVPTVPTIVRAVRSILLEAGYTVVERLFAIEEYPDDPRTVWLMADEQNQRVVVRAWEEPDNDDQDSLETEEGNPLEDLFLANHVWSSYDEVGDQYVLTRVSHSGKFLEESFPSS